MKKIIFILGILFVPFFASAEITWEEMQPAGDASLGWNTVAMSEDGQVQLAGIFGGRIYLTIDGGDTWNETQPTGAGVDKQWMSSAVSADGSTLLAGIFSAGRLYLSTDGGDTWNETQPDGDTNASWRAVAIDADGSTLVAAHSNWPGASGIFVSTNGGGLWTEVFPDGPGVKGAENFAISADGTHIVFIGVGGKIYLSTNSGTDWIDVAPESRSWFSAEMSSDGQTVVVDEQDCNDDTLFISTNAGADWVQSSVSGNAWECWYSGLGMSADGQRILIGSTDDSAGGARVYASENGGDTWVETYPTGSPADGFWISVDVSGDGTKYLISDNSRLYLGTNPLPDPILTVTKVVVNDSGGTAVVGDFSLTMDGLAITNGVATTTPAGSHTVAETATAGYTGTFSGDCAVDGTITMVAGETYTCTLTNDDIAVVEEEEEDGGGGGSSRRHPTSDTELLPIPLAPTTSTPTILEQLQLQLIELLKQLLAELLKVQ